jgi:hypothetical protein
VGRIPFEDIYGDVAKKNMWTTKRGKNRRRKLHNEYLHQILHQTPETKQVSGQLHHPCYRLPAL